MLELLWLLLPVAAFSGWLTARYRMPPTVGKWHGQDLSADYFKGLNYLLNEQPDKAIDVFIKMLDVDSETVETHLALGNLFRRRGEVDRAIRIHQNLIARPTLSREQRSHALLELGEDYMRAGLFDRAESLLLELAETGAYTCTALRHLVDVYQQEREWHKAIGVLRRLEAITGQSMGPVLAQHYCELAEQARQGGQSGEAARMLEHALSCDPNCVRASILQGDLAVAAGDYPAAIGAYKRVEEQDIEYLAEVIEPLERCYRRLGDLPALVEYLRTVLTKYTGISPMLALAELIREQEGDLQAAALVTEQLRKRPSVRGLERLIELSLAHAEGVAYDNLLILQDLIRKLLEEKPIYQCHQCGFTGKIMHWQCPTCRTWNSVKPIQGVDGE